MRKSEDKFKRNKGNSQGETKKIVLKTKLIIRKSCGSNKT